MGAEMPPRGRGWGRIAHVSSPVTLAGAPTLVGDLVLLRPVSAADASGLAALVADPEVRWLTGSQGPFAPEDLEQWYATRAQHDDRLDLAIVDRATDAYVGEAVLNELDVPNRSCSFRIALVGPTVFGRGFGGEATRLLLDHAFATVGLHRVSLEVFATNPRARHVYEKVGFRHEGTLRQALLLEGEWIDVHVMAVLAPEWARHRGRPVAQP